MEPIAFAYSTLICLILFFYDPHYILPQNRKYLLGIDVILILFLISSISTLFFASFILFLLSYGICICFRRRTSLVILICSSLCYFSIATLGFRYIDSIQARLSGQNIFAHLMKLSFSRYFDVFGVIFYLLFIFLLFFICFSRLSTINPRHPSFSYFIIVVPQLLFLSSIALFSTGLFDPIIWLPLYALIQLSVHSRYHSSSFPIVAKILDRS